MRTHIYSLVIMMLIGAFFLSPCYAVKMSSLYEITEPVASQSTQDRLQGIRQGLQQVLIRVSGDSTIVNQPGVKTALKKPERFVQEYSYLDPPSAADTGFILKMRFDDEAIAQILDETGVAVWGENRPLILLWLSVASSKGMEIIGNASPSPVYILLQKQATQDGLPIIFPVMDITDLNQIPADTILSTPVTIVTEASKRYSPDAILLGQWRQMGTMVQSHWRLSLGPQQWEWTISGNDTEVVSTLTANISQTLSKHYAVTPAKQSITSMTLEISGINQSDDLSQVVAVLKQVPTVKRVQLLEVSDEKVAFTVYLQNSVENFKQNVALNPHLVLQSKDNEASTLRYNWIP